MQSLTSLLPSVLKEIEDDDLRLIFLEELWPRIVGPDVARRCQPWRLNKGRLVCRVDDPSWRNQLSELAADLRRSINRFWGQSLVERISFQLHRMEGEEES